MTIEKFRHSNLFFIITRSFPLLISFAFLILGLFNKNETLYIITTFLFCLSLIYYILLLVDNNLSLSIFNNKKIYSKYGIHYLQQSSIQEDGINYYIFENKYWMYLSLVSNDTILYQGNDRNFKYQLLKVLDEKLDKKKKVMDLKNGMKNWNGSLDEVSNRNRKIDELL